MNSLSYIGRKVYGQDIDFLTSRLDYSANRERNALSKCLPCMHVKSLFKSLMISCYFNVMKGIHEQTATFSLASLKCDVSNVITR